jgi:probable F420-dependent oxidoreductase
MKKIKFGLQIPTGVEGLMYPIPFFLDARDNIKISIMAEKLGYDSVWGNDHIITQAYVKQRFNNPPKYFSPLITLASVAENTSKIKIGTAILVLPFQNPLIVAKELSTLDHLSNGRLIVGVGIGAYREEFESLYGQKAKNINRGEMLDESLEIICRIFENDTVTYKGKYFDIVEAQSYPKPIQNPFPFYIGGNSTNGMKRAGKYGSGWLPGGLTPEEIKAGIKRIKIYCDSFGRKEQNIEIAPQLICSISNTFEKADKKYRESQLYIHRASLQKSTHKGRDVSKYENMTLIGSPTEICEQIQNYIDVGVTAISSMLFVSNNIGEFIDSMHFFAEDVIKYF